jgi:type I restriction enzyme S subunit
MSNKGESKLVPKLRFPEFQAAERWQLAPLRQVATRTKQKNRDERIVRVLTNSAEFGVMDQRDFFDKDIATQGNLESYFVVERGSYVYNPRISTTAPVGPISKNKIGTGVMSPLYTVFKFIDDNNEFYELYFKTTGWHTYMRQTSSTGARHDRMAISSDDFMAMPLPVSTPKEQQKIADCLNSLDELIAAQARKVDALKTHKKGLMQQLFPREGETQPRLRFPEFRDAEVWEENTLGAMCDLYQPVTLSSSALSMSGEHLVYGANGVIGTHNEYNHHESEIAVTCRGATCGEVTITKPRSWITGNAMVVKPRTKKLSKDFIFQYFKNHGLKSVVSGSAQPQITRTGFAPLVIFYPRSDEQDHIASFLSSLDTLIAAETRKLEALKIHKNGLMQQLFPSAEAAEV